MLNFLCVMTDNPQFIQFFRQAAPYIHQHRGKTFVFCIQDDEKTQQVLKSLLHDIAVLHSLQVKVVIIFGARYCLNQRLSKQQFHDNRRITDIETIREIEEIVGALGIRASSILSMGLANSPMQGASISTCMGNYITAKPVGVRDGVDFGLTGEIRKVRAKAINKRLQDGDIVVILPLGYSSTGEIFNLTSEEVASSVATAVKADKLLFFGREVNAVIDSANEGKAITPEEAMILSQQSRPVGLITMLKEAAFACQHGVSRVHLIPNDSDGAVFAELFTRDGFGVMITNDAYDRIEQATVDDIPGLLQLIRPLEKQGILVRRSRELLEMEINYFSLLKRDNSVIGCAALYPYPDDGMAELGCLAVDPDYRKNGLADSLLEHVEQSARQQGIHQLFCLTTQTSHWFMERGFTLAELSNLPQKKQAFYNYARNSKVYIKAIAY